MCRGEFNDTAIHACSPPPSSAFSALLKSPWLVVVEAFLLIHNRAALYTLVLILLVQLIEFALIAQVIERLVQLLAVLH